MTGTTLLRNANYKITSDYNGIFKFDGYDGDIATRVYVDAQWTIPATFQFQNGIEIIVMNNAKINASGTMTFIRNSMLTIMEKGEVNNHQPHQYNIQQCLQPGSHNFFLCKRSNIQLYPRIFKSSYDGVC